MRFIFRTYVFPFYEKIKSQAGMADVFINGKNKRLFTQWL